MRTELDATLKRQATKILKQFETLKRMTLLEGLAHGEKAIEEGRTVTNAQAKRRMARWLK